MTFVFNGNRTCSSIQNGVTEAVVGGMNTFQQKYSGNYRAANWTLTATHGFRSKMDKFDASFQAVRGGRPLALNDNAGSSYLLVKVK